jgi:hypothetical protein
VKKTMKPDEKEMKKTRKHDEKYSTNNEQG